MGKRQKGISNPKLGMTRSKSNHLLEENVYTFMNNGQSVDESGNQFTLSNEHSNILAIKFKEGYKVVGLKNSIVKNRTYFFLHNPETGLSEIGYVLNTQSIVEVEDMQVVNDCDPCIPYAELGPPLENVIQTPHQEYVTLLKDCTENKCLNFSLDRPIMSIEIKVENVGEVMAFAHRGNPPRYIELDNLEQYEYIGEEVCGNEAQPTCLDCEKMKIFPNSKEPVVKGYERVLGGSLRKGMYEIVMAYCDDMGNERTSYFSIVTPPVAIFDEGDVIYNQTENKSETNYSIKVNLGGLDTRFSHYKVVVIENTSETSELGTLKYYSKGIYPTTHTDIIVADNRGEPISENRVHKPLMSIDHWEGLTSANGYLIGTGIKHVEEVNLQPVFNLMGGLIKWQSTVVKGDLYKAANSNQYKGYNRDEVYPLAIRPISSDGYQYPKYPLVGRLPEESDLEDTEEDDINMQSINTNLGECDGTLRTKKWQNYNTATEEGRCDNFNSVNINFYGFNGEGDIIIDGTPYNIAFNINNPNQTIEELVEEFVNIQGPIIEVTHEVGIINIGNRIVINPEPSGEVVFEGISGNIRAEIDTRGLPTTMQNQDLEIITEVLPLRDTVVATLLGTDGIGEINIYGSGAYLIEYEYSLENTARNFVRDRAADISNDTGIIVTAKDNTLVFDGLEEGVTFTNMIGDLDVRVSEKGIPPIPDTEGPINIHPSYIDSYKDLKTYLNGLILSCQDNLQWQQSPISGLCPWLDLDNLEAYNAEPIPEDGCQDPRAHLLTEYLEIYNVIGESPEYTDKPIQDYLKTPPPSNCKVFVEHAEEGIDGNNLGVDTVFSGTYFLDPGWSIDEIRDRSTYNGYIREKQYVTYAEELSSAARVQNITLENRGDFESVTYVHPYHGEMLVEEDVTSAYVNLKPIEGATGTAKIIIEGSDYEISIPNSGTIEDAAIDFVTDHSSTILTLHNLTVTSNGSTLQFDGSITTTNQPTILNITGNLRGDSSIGNNYIRSPESTEGIWRSTEPGLLTKERARRILTDRNPTTYRYIDPEEINNTLKVNENTVGTFETKFFDKIHKGAIWFEIESRGRKKFIAEITKLLEPGAPSIKRIYGTHNIGNNPFGIGMRTPFIKNTYVRYTLFEDEYSMNPLQELRDDLSKSEIEISGTSGEANIRIDVVDYAITLNSGEEIADAISRFIMEHAENIRTTLGQTVSNRGDKIIFTGETQGFDPATISTVSGDLGGTATTSDGGYFDMGGIINLKENHLIEIEMERMLVSSTFNGKFYMVIDLPVTVGVGLGESSTPGDDGALPYYTAITVPLGSCFSVVTRDEEFSKIEVNYESIELSKIQNWLMRCTFDVPIINSCKPIPHKYGKFSYWESTEIYPDNAELYDSSWLSMNIKDFPKIYWNSLGEYIGEIDEEGDIKLSDETNLMCKPIRHFKFPDNKVSPFMYERKTNRDSEVVIYPLGVRIEDELFETFMDMAVENGLITQDRRSRIVGYEVYRGDRRIDKTVLTSGMLFDMRKYQNDIGDDIYYPNYPYNSLGEDKFNNNTTGGKLTLNPNKNHIFTFHGPEQDYYKGNTGYSELSVQGYLFGTSRTTIAEVEDHPKYTILGESAKKLATKLATAEVIAEAVANIANSGEVYRIQIGMANSLNPVGMVFSIANIISSTITLVTTKVSKYRYEWMKTFKNLGSPTNFAYYSTSVAKYNYFRTLQSEGNLFRGIATSKVINSGTYSITENVTGNPIIINNLDRESSLMVSFTKDFPLDHSASSRYLEYKNYDNNNFPGRGSQVRSSEIGCSGTQSSEAYRNVASPYVALKTYIPNQYGSIGNIQWVSTGRVSDLSREECGMTLGGDIFIAPHSVKRKVPFFKASAFGQADLTPFAYSLLGNIGKPRYYIDYEINTERATKELPMPEIDSVVKTDCTDIKFYLENPSKFYLYSYGQPEFFVETSINTNYRNARPEPWNQFYPQNQDYVGLTQEKEVSIRRPNNYYYNYTYSYPGTLLSPKVLPDNYNKEVFRKRAHNTNSAMYSMQDVNEDSTAQPWLSYKPLDFHVFPKSNGSLIHIKGIENKQILAVFENTTEIYNAVDTFVKGINSSNTEIGTGGLFASGAVRTFSETDLGYIGSQSRSLLSNEFGHFMIDSLRGQVFNISPGAKSGGSQEISRYSQGKPNGMDVWFKEHLPFKILRRFPEYKEYTDNPYNGVGIAMGWDSKFRRVLITKKDYVPVSANIIEDKGIFYNSEKDVVDGIKAQYPEYTYEGIEGHEVKFISGTEEEIYVSLPKVELWDENFFRDVSWTITYKPESGYWESYMDFKPNYYINHTDYFQTGVNNSNDEKENGLWSHLLTNKSKQVFYGKKYPWTVEFPTKNEYAPKKLEGLEIWSEAKRYHNGYDYAIDDRITFNKLNIFSDSQSSGNLELIPNNGSLSMLSKYPITYEDRQEILITRKEGRWTLNDIYNRAKSNRNNIPLFTYDHNQIGKKVNPDSVSFYGKKTLEQLTSENFLVRLTQDKTTQYDMELKFVLQTEEIL